MAFIYILEEKTSDFIEFPQSFFPPLQQLLLLSIIRPIFSLFEFQFFLYSSLPSYGSCRRNWPQTFLPSKCRHQQLQMCLQWLIWLHSKNFGYYIVVQFEIFSLSLGFPPWFTAYLASWELNVHIWGWVSKPFIILVWCQYHLSRDSFVLFQPSTWLMRWTSTWPEDNPCSTLYES
jgi:hypothetical protein